MLYLLLVIKHMELSGASMRYKNVPSYIIEKESGRAEQDAQICAVSWCSDTELSSTHWSTN